MGLLEFMHEHWFLALIMIVSTGSAVHAMLWMPYRFYKIRCRRKNIEQHGWPVPPLDADGDIVHPEPTEKEES